MNIDDKLGDAMDTMLLKLDQHELCPDEVTVGDRASYFHRVAARAVLFDGDGRIALMHAAKHGYYKLPGGGVDEGETIEGALIRELLEETGAHAVVQRELGVVEEWRDLVKMRQLSYAYVAMVVGEVGEPSLTQGEIDQGFEVVWAKDVDEAVQLIESSNIGDDKGMRCMITRDSAIVLASVGVV